MKKASTVPSGPSVLVALCVIGTLVLGHAFWPDLTEAAQAGTLEPAEIERAFPGLTFPSMVHLTSSGDGTDRLWIVLQPGLVKVFANDRAAATASVFLDIRDRVNDAGSEEGLLGLAFDPDYATNGYFYVDYTAAIPPRSVISRFSVSAGDPDQADPQSEVVLLEVTQPFPNHNAGTLAFGPDGYLYIALGDGGSGGDPFGHGQDATTLLGSILRIDVSNATPQQPYQVPGDNPFAAAGGGVREEIWAYGLRNPWKFSFDTITGDLWAGDVGQNSFEEIDLIRKGRNYGWNIMEGLHCYPPTVQICDQAGLEPPVFEYPIPDLGCAIIGGHVYRGKRLARLDGAYLYGDFCSGRIWALRYDGASVTDQALLADTTLQITAFGADESGEVYILALDGLIYWFVAPAEPVPSVTLWSLAALAAMLAAALLSRFTRKTSPR